MLFGCVGTRKHLLYCILYISKYVHYTFTYLHIEQSVGDVIVSSLDGR